MRFAISNSSAPLQHKWKAMQSTALEPCAGPWQDRTGLEAAPLWQGAEQLTELWSPLSADQHLGVQEMPASYSCQHVQTGVPQPKSNLNRPSSAAQSCLGEYSTGTGSVPSFHG